MKIEIKQTKLIEILDYLYVDGLFPFSIISTKGGKLVSVQSHKDGIAFRFASFLGDYFKSITKEEETVQIDIEKIKKFASLRNPDAIITLEYPVNKKLKISSERARNMLSVPTLDADVAKTGLPFQMKEGIPHLRKGTVPLSAHVAISLKSFKTMNDYAVAHGTEFFRFKIGENKKLQVDIGDMNAMEDKTEYNPNCQVFKTDGDLDVTFTKGIKELSKTFSRDVDIYLKSNMPAWFSEVSQSHKFGVLLSPLRQEA